MRLRTFTAALALAALAAPSAARADDRPNILWITCEDMSPNLGCYGDPYAVTPNLDRLASQGVRYTRAYATIGVCAPSRSTIITGMYPPSIGTHHMRCQGTLPAGIKEFPRYLREAGYYCTNNVKTDYNFKHDPSTWDESSNRAHWRNRRPGQPFFAVFNFTTSHESQIRLPEEQYQKRTAEFTDAQRHDPSKAPVPPYYPDTPRVRQDWARYYDMITYMDAQVGEVLEQLEADGLANSTIVIYYSDHGAGMPRSKRWLYDSSTRVPFIVRTPEKFASLASGKPGTSTDRLVSFIDLAPTALSLAGVPLPDHLQGQAYLGEADRGPREYVYGFRDRMDERYDMLRSVTDGRYRYIRNYLPQLPWFGGQQYVSYMYEMPTMQDWQRLADAGQLKGPAAAFMASSKPTEELFDTQADPWEIHNLADSAEHRAVLERLRGELRRWEAEILDLGFLPEPDLRTRFGDRPPHDAVRESPGIYPFETIREAAEMASRRDPAEVGTLVDRLRHDDPAVRWWAATGLGAIGDEARSSVGALAKAVDDPKSWVRVAAADALCRLGETGTALPTLIEAMSDENEWSRLWAINVLDRLDEEAAPARAVIEKAASDPNAYVVRVAERAREALAK